MGSDEVRVRITLAEHEGRPRQLEGTAPRGELCLAPAFA
jgi:hypothetical protein